MTFKVFFISAFMLALSPAYAAAQDSSSTGGLDEVIATGKIKTGDDAMAAFFNGDFETAEIEFEKNFKNLTRIENNLQNTLLQSRSNQVSNTIRGGIPQTGAQGGAASTPQSSISIDVSTLSRTSGRRKGTITSGTDKGFQLYMAGLSQIQLGKYDDAKVSLKRAVRLNKEIYDARTRLGLLEIRDENFDEARKQLLKLDKLRKRCNNKCKYKTEIRTSTLTLAKELAKG